ncbi:hypothetical protein CERSUDRAFT_102465 [Gelatoporia subvermispora B]|uniref:EamA domain-containing protein n=1 Tax=Ceriporiopsis subvermispora (strain B) TaxID=914234 RepID=M2QY72_CERS8|nr:hypothetical protein CERSUDRAFT_102465 [Gelatoporia subvermispora B]
MTHRHAAAGVTLGGKAAVSLFIVSLLAFVAESQLTEYVQNGLGFRQPYFIFYVVHSSFSIMLPIHMLYLAISSNSIGSLWAGLILALKRQLSSSSIPVHLERGLSDLPTRRFVAMILLLTAGMTIPGLLWFLAVPLAPITDVTALWNTNAFFAYLFSVKLMHLTWEPRRLAAVLFATLGATIVVYGSGASDGEDTSANSKASLQGLFSLSPAFLGDMLTLVASVVYGLYQVLYKLHIALPSDPEVQADAAYRCLATSSEAIPDDLEESMGEIAEPDPTASPSDAVYPPPFGLYPNFLTSAIGLCTFLVLWIPIPILHFYDITPFYFPTTSQQVFVIAGIALGGAIFNAGFMILMGVWGPIVTSVGSLLTIVLMFASDALFGRSMGSITIWSMLGSGCIVLAFTALAYEIIR